MPTSGHWIACRMYRTWTTAPAPTPEAHAIWQGGTPPKPETEPTSIDFEDYGYYMPNGKFKFWMGFDAKFKSALFTVSRSLDSPRNEEAVAILASRCWSTPEHERQIRLQLARRAQRLKERAG